MIFINREQKNDLIKIIISAVLVVIFSLLPIENRYIRLVLFLISYLISGFEVLKEAVEGILKKEFFDENFLMAIATIGAMALGEYREGVAVMLFFKIGELFEDYAVDKSRDSISRLMDLRPDYINIETDGKITRSNPNEAQTGSIIVVSAGERVAIDGVVISGSTTADTSAITGESVPRSLGEGDEILSGYVNLSGTIRMRTTKEFSESTVSKILKLVEDSAEKKSKSEKFISKFAEYYTPAVCIAALIIAIVPPLAVLVSSGENVWLSWIYRALTFLVISCPCALVISIPLSFFAGIGGASREGILIKGSNYIEALSKAKQVVFDKTGTLTKGTFEVSEVHHCTIDEDKLIEYAALAECYSTHPIGKSLVAAVNEAIDTSRVENVEEISAYGITASVDGKSVAVGNDKLMKRLGIDFTPCTHAGTVVHVAIDGEYGGHILISDVIKPDSHEAIKLLHDTGVRKTVMLTGDSDTVAQSVAAELEIDEVFSELLPADKVSKIEDMIESNEIGGSIAFVGDGINDAPVLTRSDIGIAMGAIGSDAAIEAADVVIMDDNPSKLARAIRISKKCIKIVYENIYFAIGIKLLCLILGTLGIANMWMAIFADVGVMVIAVLNAIRAFRTKNL